MLHRSLVLLILAAVGPSLGARAAELPTPVRITLKTAPQAGQPGVALEPQRGFIVTWQESKDGDSSLHYATLDFSGRETARGLIARGREWFVNWADTPAVAVLDNGDWVAFWLERGDPSIPKGYDIRVVRSVDRGKTWSKPVSPHRDGTPTQHGFVSLVPDGADRVLVVWLDGRLSAGPAAGATAGAASHDHEADAMTLRAAAIDRTGAITREALLDERTCSCCQTDAARWAGRTLVAYRDRSAKEIRDIAVVARGNDGKWSAPRELNADGWHIEGCPVNGPAVAVNGQRLLVFWPTLVGEQMELRYTLREWDKPGAAITLKTPAAASGRVDAAPWKDGFILTWVSRASDRPNVEFAWVDARGVAQLGPAIAQPKLRGRATGFPRVASDGTRALFVWPESDGGGDARALGVALMSAAR